MADVDVTQELPLPVERPRPVAASPLAWLRANLFNSIPNTILTLAAVYPARGDDPAGDPLGVCRRDLECGQRARLPRRRRLLGLHRAKAPLHPVRPISLRGALAAAPRRGDLRRPDPGKLRSPSLGPPPRGSLACRADCGRGADVGRHPWHELCRGRTLERAATDPNPAGRRHDFRLSAGDPVGARTALSAARSAGHLRRIYRARPRRAADHGACSWPR